MQHIINYADPDVYGVHIDWICHDIEGSFPGISCEVTEIPLIKCTHVPEDSDTYYAVRAKFSAIIEKNKR